MVRVVFRFLHILNLAQLLFGALDLTSHSTRFLALLTRKI